MLISFLFTALIETVGEDRLGALLSSVPVVGQLIAGLIGLIPNCAASVVITQLYLEGLISSGCMMAGLLVGAGIGVTVLFRVNHRHIRDNIRLVGLLYAIGVLAGVLIDVIGITFGNRSLRVKVLAVPEFANKEQAALLYQELPAEE